MSEVINCKKCGNMFKYYPGKPPLCSDCISKEEDEFKRVKEYLYDNPGASLTEVANATEISTRKLTRYLREGRIEIIGDTNMLLECTNCGKSIKTGKLCQECEISLKQELASTGNNIRSKMVAAEDYNKMKRGMKYLNKNER